MNRIRLASPSDAEGVLAIYAPIVRDTVISFELEVPTVSQMQERIDKTLAEFPWLVAESGERIIGYTYASRHQSRVAYQWSADVSVYVAEDARGKGIGRALYTRLLGMLADMSY